MARDIVYYRRGPEGVLASSNVADAFTAWRGDRECWMFVAAHDDDIIAGAGMFVQAAIAEFETALELYGQRRFATAKAAFERLAVDDETAKVYVERCTHYQAEPPADDWDGSFVSKTK